MNQKREKLYNLKLEQEANLKNLRRNLKDKQKILKPELQTLESTLKEKSEELKENLRRLENNQLKELTKKMSQEIPNCHPELEMYLKYGEYVAISERNEALLREQRRLYSLLKEKLGKINKDFNWLEEQGYEISKPE